MIATSAIPYTPSATAHPWPYSPASKSLPSTRLNINLTGLPMRFAWARGIVPSQRINTLDPRPSATRELDAPRRPEVMWARYSCSWVECRFGAYLYLPWITLNAVSIRRRHHANTDPMPYGNRNWKSASVAIVGSRCLPISKWLVTLTSPFVAEMDAKAVPHCASH